MSHGEVYEPLHAGRLEACKKECKAYKVPFTLSTADDQQRYSQRCEQSDA